MKIDPWGIQDGYTDALGAWRPTPEVSRDAVRRAMSVDAADLAAPPRVLVRRQGRAPVRLDAPGEIALEDGSVRTVHGRLPADLPLGYHELRQDARPPVRIIVAPAACHLPRRLKTWGWAVQLYGARSRGSWGMGDLSDLHVLGHWAAARGAGALLLNPIGATNPGLPQQASPYFPSSRRYRNPLYLRIDAVPGAAGAGLDLNRLDRQGRALNDSPYVDRDRLYPLKLAALELLWRTFPGDDAFETYRREQGHALREFATFCALAETAAGPWRSWDPAHRRPDSPAVARFAAAHDDRVRFHEWLQWLLDVQLAQASRPVSIIQDLPIGIDPDGADAWAWQEVLAAGMTVGAPPDEFNTRGQDWGLPPFVPHRLRAAGYEPFIQTIRASLRHGGGLRIDHVMGLFRLYWIPRGHPASQGAYVRNPASDLLAILALESHRARALIVGEDLGTVEEPARRQLVRQKVLSYRLVWFEKQSPAAYPRRALAAVTTHDLPTIAGLWTGSDLEEQRRLGLAPNDEGTREIRDRLQASTRVGADAPVAHVIERTYGLLARAPSAILAATLEDAFEVEARPNVPGTTRERPNWSIPLPRTIEALPDLPLARTIGDALGRRRRGAASRRPPGRRNKR
jgi:4-alpha-glucanotransferase